MADTHEEYVAQWHARMMRGIAQSIPMTVEDVRPERVIVSMPVDARTHQPWGRLHGGASVVLAETAASIGGNANCAPDKTAVGQEINANHLRPVSEGTIRAVGVPIHIGRTSHVWQIEIRDEQERLVCVSRCTLAVVDMPEGAAGRPVPPPSA